MAHSSRRYQLQAGDEFQVVRSVVAAAQSPASGQQLDLGSGGNRAFAVVEHLTDLGAVGCHYGNADHGPSMQVEVVNFGN
jgi:hypothetical protein